MTTIKDAVLIAFSIVDRVDRAFLLNAVNNYSTAFSKNYIRTEDNIPKKNESILFYSDFKNDIRLTKYGFKSLNKLLNKVEKQKTSNQPNHNNMMWQFILDLVMINGIPDAIKRESNIKLGLISDLEIKYGELTLYIEVETGTQAADTVQYKINKYNNQLKDNEYLIIYSKSINKLNKLILTDKILIIDSNVKFDYKVPKINTYEAKNNKPPIKVEEKLHWTADLEEFLLSACR